MTQKNIATENTRMAELLESLGTREGFSQTGLEGVQIIKNTRTHPRHPAVYNPSVVIVAQGQKKGYLGDKVYTYDADNYLTLSVLLPFECEIVRASEEQPFLALSIGVDLAVLSELMLELGEPADGCKTVCGASSCPLTPELRSAAVRLLECLQDREDCRILGRQVVREIIYRVLQGEHGAALRALTGMHGSFGQIARALQRIHTEYQTPLDVETLARTANMSVSVFHQHFKTVTSTSPIQYIKSIRLHKARMLMAQEGFNAKSAAGEVGYSSPSQFSREFKRVFGKSPAEEANRMRHIGFSE